MEVEEVFEAIHGKSNIPFFVSVYLKVAESQ